jgi:class 3 adenylate cyclase/tetratricopeptide (TPR) repeat protein
VALGTPLELLVSYLPEVVVRQLADDAHVDDTTWVKRFTATLLFVDVVGFTSLTRLLEQRGQQGVEDLSRLMNEFWDQLIELVSAHGGDVVKFSGDAVLVAWPVQEGDGSAATLRAVRCGTQISARFRAFQTSQEVLISTRVSVFWGDVLVAGIRGLNDRWRFFLAGECLSQLEPAAAVNNPGDVILSNQAWSHIGSLATAQRVNGEFVRLTGLALESEVAPVTSAQPPPTLSEVLLRAYVPEPVLYRFDAGQTEWLAEFRRVSILFLNVAGVKLESNGSLVDLESVVNAFDTPVSHFGGTFKDIRVDDKGMTLIAVFGAPPNAHEDDPVRAVRTATRIAESLDGLGFRYGIGIATGRTFCGAIGNSRRRDYDINGDPVPLAARLMVAAELEGVLCDEATFEAARERIAFDALPTFRLKGVEQGVHVFRPLVSSSSEPMQTPRGESRRAVERAHLKELVARLAERQGGVVIIEGEPGIGKSHLARTLAADAARSGVRCVIGACDATERVTSYFAWREVFAELCGMPRTRDRRTAREMVLTRLAGRTHLLRVAPLLNTVLPVDLPDNEVTAQMTGEVRANNTQELLLALLREPAEQAPLVVVLEDCHWLDSASWALVRAASLDVRSILLVLTTRPFVDVVPPTYAALVQTADCTRIQLQPFLASQTAGLLCDLLHVRRVSQPLVNFVTQRAEGNAFFIQELAYALRDANTIAVVNGECGFIEGDQAPVELHVPRTIEGLVTSRIDQLDAAAQLTLKVASVIGLTFTYDTLAAIHPVQADRQHLSAHLAALEQAHLCQLADDAHEQQTFAFTHGITHEIAYQLLPFDQRRRLHLALAETYERGDAATTEKLLPLLAHNFRMAGENGRALVYLERAGDQALRLFNNADAIRFFEQALSLADEVSPAPGAAQRAGWHLQLGQALINLSRYMEGTRELEAGLALSGRPLPRGRMHQVVRVANQACVQLLHRMWPSHYIGTAREPYEKLHPLQQAYQSLAEAYYYSHQSPILVIAVVYHAANLSEEMGSPAALADGYASMGGLMGMVPLRGFAEAYFQRALHAAEASGSLSAYPLVWIAAGLYDVGVGKWAEANQYFSQLVELATHLGDRRRWMDGISNLIWIKGFQGDFGPVGNLAQELRAAAERQRDPRYEAEALVALAANELVTGRVDQALGHLANTATLFAQHESIADVYIQLELSGLEAIGHLRASRPDAARTAADRALALTSHSRPFSYFPDGYTGPAEVYLGLWELGGGTVDVQRNARKACDALRRYAAQFPIGLPRLHRYAGLLHWHEGKRTNAIRDWTESLAAAARLGMRYDEALAHFELGRHSSKSAPEREEHLRQARTMLEACSAHYDLSAAELAMGMSDES